MGKTVQRHLMYEDKASIELVCQQKGWGAKRICKEFPNKNWAVSSVKDLLRKIDKTNSISRKVGSGRKRTVRTTQNIECAAELICSHKGIPGSSKIPRDSEGHIEQLFTCCCMKFSLFYLDVRTSTYFHLCFTIVI